MGKKTPLYSGGNNPTVIPLTSPAQSGTTAREGRYYRSTQRYCRSAWGPDPRAVLPPGKSGTTAPGGTTASTQRYCRAAQGRDTRAVLPLGKGGTTT